MHTRHTVAAVVAVVAEAGAEAARSVPHTLAAANMSYTHNFLVSDAAEEEAEGRSYWESPSPAQVSAWVY